MCNKFYLTSHIYNKMYVIAMFCWAIHVTKLYKQYITVSNCWFMFRSLHPEYDRETTWRYVEIRLSFTVIDRDEEWVMIFRGIQLSYHNFCVVLMSALSRLFDYPRTIPLYLAVNCLRREPECGCLLRPGANMAQ